MTSVSDYQRAILLVMFGTSVESGLPALLHINERFITKFSNTRVYLTFTSKIISRIWQERADDKVYRKEHVNVPEEIFRIKSPAAVIAAIAETGVESLVIQPVQIAPAVCELNAADYIGDVDPDVLDRFQTVCVGRPAFGTFGCRHPYAEDVNRVALALAQDISLARKEKAALCYLGHGNRFPDTGRVYAELVEEMRRQYPDISVYMGMVEGGESFKDVAADLQSHGVTRVILKPFMIVAGDHVRKEMLGKGTHTLQTLLENEGIVVLPVATGLGEVTAFADIFVRNAADAAAEAGIALG